MMSARFFTAVEHPCGDLTLICPDCGKSVRFVNPTAAREAWYRRSHWCGPNKPGNVWQLP